MNLTRSQIRGLVSVGSAVFGISSAYKDLRRARGTGDTLVLADAVISLAAVLTGVAIAIRAMREDDE